MSDRFTRILGIFTWNKQSHTQSPGLSVLPESLSTEEKTQHIWFAFTAGDSCAGPQKTSLFLRQPAAGWGCPVILQTTSDGGIEEVNPPHPAPRPTRPGSRAASPASDAYQACTHGADSQITVT